MAFAYGSGVFQQTGHDMSKNMLDFIMVVDNPDDWHGENIERNSKHYSFLKHLGPKAVSKIQNSYGAGIYFNTLVPFEQRLIKYGVIGTDVLISDLINWDTLYVSGRLHKPVKVIKEPHSSTLLQAMQTNLKSAVHSSLLLLPETFTETELYMTITSLSYSGDFRMKFGEDKGKVSKIVAPNLPYFNKLYEPILNGTDYLTYSEDTKLFLQSRNKETNMYHLNHAPDVVIDKMSALHGMFGLDAPKSDILLTLASDSKCDKFVSESIANIVNKSSWSQSIKGIFTAGISKSVRYSLSKVKKMLKM